MKKLKPTNLSVNRDPRLTFLRLLEQQDFALTSSLLEIGSEDLVKSLLMVFDGAGQALPLLQYFLQREILATGSEGTLFRGVSIGARMLSHYMRMHGREYLHNTLGNFFRTCLSQDIELEVDPQRVHTSACIEKGCSVLMKLAHSLVDAIFSTPNSLPTALRDLFAYLQVEVMKRFPEMKDRVVGGFFFLRFVCPALLSPEQWGIVDDPPTPGLRRTLILISKVIQNLANELEFGDKEAYMMPMNVFIQQNIPRMKEFLTNLSAVPTTRLLVNERESTWEDMLLQRLSDEYTKSLFDVFDQASQNVEFLRMKLRTAGHNALAEELLVVEKEFPSRDEMSRQNKKRALEQRKRKDEKHKDKPAAAELEDIPNGVDTPGRRQLNRLLSTSKKLLPKFAAPNAHEQQSVSSDGTTLQRKFLKAKRNASASVPQKSD